MPYSVALGRCVSAFCGRDPMVLGSRRIMTNMLLIASTFEFSHPAGIFIEMESDDFRD